MRDITNYSNFLFSRLLPSFSPLLQIIAAKFVVDNPIDLSRIIVLIALQTQLSLFISANRDEKLFIQNKDNNFRLSILKEILKRIFFSFILGLPTAFIINLFIDWDLNFVIIFISFIFSSHKSLDKLMSLCDKEQLVIKNIFFSFVFYFLLLIITKKVILSFLLSSIFSLLIYLFNFLDFKFIRKIIFLSQFKLKLRNMIRDFTSYEQNDVRASSIVIFLSTRLDQFALASMALSASPFVIAYLTLKKFVDFSGNFFVLFFSKDTYKKTSIYTDKELIKIYSIQFLKFLFYMILIFLIIISISVITYGLSSSIIILIIILSTIFNSWGSQKGPAYTRYKLQKKNLYFLIIALFLSLPIYFLIGFNLYSTIISSLITALLVNFILPLMFIKFDKNIFKYSINLLIRKIYFTNK